MTLYFKNERKAFCTWASKMETPHKFRGSCSQELEGQMGMDIRGKWVRVNNVFITPNAQIWNFRKVYKKIAKITNKSLFLQELVKKDDPDERRIFPIPESVNHQYGWISTRPEFQLEIYGPDIMTPKFIKEEY